MVKVLANAFEIQEEDSENFIKLSPKKSTIHIVGNFK
jgi:hypothetical protein